MTSYCFESAETRFHFKVTAYDFVVSHCAKMRFIRLSIVGLGVVGRWLSDSIERRRVWLERECHVRVPILPISSTR
jgi:hypothetical protein